MRKEKTLWILFAALSLWHVFKEQARVIFVDLPTSKHCKVS